MFAPPPGLSSSWIRIPDFATARIVLWGLVADASFMVLGF